MGLDLLDLIFRLEKRFEIKITRGDLDPIPDRRTAEAMAHMTAGDLVPFVSRKLRQPEDGRPVCLAARAFYEVRRAMLETWDVGRNRVRRDSRVFAMIPARHHTAVWRKLAVKLGLPPPPPFGWLFGNDEVPPPDTTVRDIVRRRMRRSPHYFFAGDGTVVPERVWDALPEVLSDWSGLPEDQIRPGMRLFRDFQ